MAPGKKTEKTPPQKTVATLVHDEASRKNIPTAEFQSVMRPDDQRPVRVPYERRNRDLDPQLIWRGKYPNDDIDAELPFTVAAPPLYIQEKVHPKALIDDLKRQTEQARRDSESKVPAQQQIDLFADFNGLPATDARTEFYQHDQHWSNRMVLGDSLQVMASLAEREGLRGKVQCIYFDPPYGIKFNSNFQWSTTSRDVKDGNLDHITREPEQVKAFRDTWRDGIHSYLSYLRDLLTESGSIFVQIGDENVHRLRVLMDEILGDDNFIVQIALQKTGSQTGEFLQSNLDHILVFARDKERTKFRRLHLDREIGGLGGSGYTNFQMPDLREVSLESLRAGIHNDRIDPNLIWRSYPLTSDGLRDTTSVPFRYQGKTFRPGKGRHRGLIVEGLDRVGRAGRLTAEAEQVHLKRFFGDSTSVPLGPLWLDVGGAANRVYVVQTSAKAIQRCILMTTDPGDLVLDPTCGSGTTAYVAEQWGRRWITIDTSRVALALARARVMGARYPFYLLADSREGQAKEPALQGRVPPNTATRGDVRQGFVYERVPHITLKSIANNAEIDLI